MKQSFLLVAILILFFSCAQAQTDFIFTKAKNIETEHRYKPREFKTNELSWGLMNSECREDVITHGNWFKLYPKTSILKVEVYIGMTDGTLVNPYIYVGYMDTINGIPTLVEMACKKFDGSVGKFDLEVYNLKNMRLHYLLIGGDAKKQTFALNLTQRFTPTDLPPPEEEEAVANDEAPIPSETAEPQTTATSQPAAGPNPQSQGSAMILGRLRDANGKVLANTKVMMLNDDLQQIQEVSTDEYGGFRFEGVNPDKINLVKMSKDDSKWLIDMFMYDENLEVIGKPIPLGHRLHSFKSRADYFQDLRILTENDVFVDVEHGKSYMTGKVVDKETYLVGREGVKVGLYNNTRSLVKTAITDLNGRFSFYDLENEEYIVKVEHNPEKDYVEIVISDSLNVPYKSANSNDMTDDGYFKFKALPKEIVELRRMEVMEDRGMLASALEDEPKVLIDEKNVGVAIELSTIEFNTGSSQLTLAKNRELDQLAEELINKPSIRIKIDGHTDNVGKEADNKRLSDERAAAVKSYLVGHGVASSRIITEGFGSSKPVASNDNEDGRSKNRRVEFTILN